MDDIRIPFKQAFRGPNRFVAYLYPYTSLHLALMNLLGDKFEAVRRMCQVLFVTP